MAEPAHSLWARRLIWLRWIVRADCWPQWSMASSAASSAQLEKPLALAAEHPLCPPYSAVERNRRLSLHRHLRRAGLKPGEGRFAHHPHLFDHASGPRHGNLTGNVVLALELGAHKQNKVDQIGRGLLEDSDG